MRCKNSDVIFAARLDWKRAMRAAGSITDRDAAQIPCVTERLFDMIDDELPRSERRLRMGTHGP